MASKLEKQEDIQHIFDDNPKESVEGKNTNHIGSYANDDKTTKLRKIYQELRNERVVYCESSL